MELLEGETLAARLAGGPLDALAVVDHGIALADALEVAHARGMLHRDLKPANIFLTTRGVLKILDFGLTKAIDTADTATRAADGVTRAGHAIRTGVGYMSPEQLRGELVDAQSNEISAGAVLYEMVTGARAFDGPTNAVVPPRGDSPRGARSPGTAGRRRATRARGDHSEGAQKRILTLVAIGGRVGPGPHAREAAAGLR